MNQLPFQQNKDLLPDIVRNAIECFGLEKEVFIVEINPDHADTETFVKEYDWGPEKSANCIVVEAKRGDKKSKVACLILADARADINGTIRRHLDARKVSMANKEEVLEETKMEYGGVTVIGLPSDWKILVDSRIQNLDTFIIGGGNRSTKLMLAGETLAKIPNVEFLENMAK